MLTSSKTDMACGGCVQRQPISTPPHTGPVGWTMYNKHIQCKPVRSLSLIIGFSNISGNHCAGKFVWFKANTNNFSLIITFASFEKLTTNFKVFDISVIKWIYIAWIFSKRFILKWLTCVWLHYKTSTYNEYAYQCWLSSCSILELSVRTGSLSSRW